MKLKHDKSLHIWDGQLMMTALINKDPEYFKKPGHCIEVGAYDGKEQSNTYTLEYDLGWEATLIEPIYHEKAKINRPNAQVLNFALGDKKTRIGITPRSLYTSLITKMDGASVKVDVKRMDQLIFDNIDFLSIDTEGFEVNVLKGAQQTIQKHLPKYILIEVQYDNLGDVQNLLPQYDVVNFSNYSRRLPHIKENWSADYDDFLFILRNNTK